MQPRWTALALASAALVGTACAPDVSVQIQQANETVAQAAESHVDGPISVNAAPFSPSRCLSGQLAGFSGVDVLGIDGSRLRLVQEADGSGTVVQTGMGATPVTMKGCGRIEVRPTGAMVDGVRVVRGTAQLDCTAGDLHVAGDVTFQCGQ